MPVTPSAAPLPEGYRSPFDDHIGSEVVEAGPDRVVVTLEVTATVHQPTGVVHGGVYATLVETAASIGASLWLAGDGHAVGVSNATDFFGAVREGTLRAEAVPLQRGRSMQAWAVEVTTEDGRRVAHGKVRLFNLRQR